MKRSHQTPDQNGPQLEQRRIGLTALLVLVTCLIYLPALRAGFLWDDSEFLTKNPVIHAADGFWRVWIPSKHIEYYPVTWTTFWLEWRLWGTDATGYHAVNILLHICGALLVWKVLERLKVPGAWLGALLFAVHPVNVESVAWIAERKNTLSLVFYALAVLSFLHFERDGDRRWYWAAYGCFLLGLLSKTSGVVLPAVLVLCAWWQRGTITRRDLLRVTPFVLLAVLFAGITLWSQFHIIGAGGGGGGAGSGPQRTIWFRLGASGHVFWFYLRKVLLPVDLMTIYPLWKFDTVKWWFWLPSTLVVVLLAGAWFLRHRLGRGLVFGLLYFIVLLLPVLGVYDAPYIRRSPVVSDHLQYLATIGILALAAAGVARLPVTGRQFLSVVFVGGLGLLSWQRAVVHQDQVKLWQDTLAKNPSSGRAHFILGEVFTKRRDFEAATSHYTAAIALNYSTAKGRNNLANALAILGRRKEAFPHYAEAVRLQPKFPQAERNWATALAQDGQLAEAIPHFQAAVRLDPNDAQSHNNLGVLLLRQGQLAEAAKHFAEAVRCDPGNPEYRRNLDFARAARP